MMEKERLTVLRAETRRGFEFDHNVENIEDLSDDLGREAIARAIAQEIRGDPRSRVIGVFGWWGSGKSYLLSLTAKQLLEGNRESNEQVLVGTFSPWRYEEDGDLAAGMVRSLYRLEEQFKHRNPSLCGPATYKAIAQALLDLVVGLAPAFGTAGLGVAAAGSLVRGVGTRINASRAAAKAASPTSTVDQIRSTMEKLVEAIIHAAETADPSKSYRLVVLVDDLDRCSPENMVRMLEWLKNHLAAERCIYVLALDHVAAAQAIVGKYKEYLGAEPDVSYGFRYLEKIVDNEYALGLAPQVELMALRHVYGKTTQFHRLSGAARTVCGGDFPGVGMMDELLKLRSLQVPRTMLKLSARFRRVLELIIGESGNELRTQLPPSYPFWILLLTTMYYLLDPEYLSDLVLGRGRISTILTGQESLALNKPAPEFAKEPVREFVEYCSRVVAASGSTMRIPSKETLSQLASIVRQTVI